MERDLCAVNPEEKELLDQLERWVEENRDQMVRDIFTAIAVKSVSGEPQGCYPYGLGCGKMLDTMSALAAGAGFPFHNHCYHCGTVELKGSGPDTIGIFAHVDTVEEGRNWSSDPFVPFLQDGYIYGRGATDDKGPAVAALYVLKCLRDLKIPLRHNVLLYFGCDEEARMRDLRYYLEHNPPPVLSLIPDARFSVCSGEKGIIRARLLLDLEGTAIRFLRAGSGENVVPNLAEMGLACTAREAAQLMACPDIGVTFANGIATIQAEGISGHAAFPENAENAVERLVKSVIAAEVVSGRTADVLAVLSRLSAGYLGEELGIAAQDDFFGPLTSVASLVQSDEEKLTVTLNIRYPIATDGATIRQQLEEFAAATGLVLESYKDDPPAYVAPDSPVVRMLNDLCCQVLGQEFSPYSMGGGTYARRLPSAMACGPLNRYLDRPGGTRRGGGHQPDECICLESLENLIKIYVRAIAQIDGMIDLDNAEGKNE